MVQSDGIQIWIISFVLCFVFSTIRSQSYKTLMSSFFRFLLLSLSVCRTGKYCLYIKLAKRNSKKRKKSLFYEAKSLVGLTPESNNRKFGKINDIIIIMAVVTIFISYSHFHLQIKSFQWLSHLITCFTFTHFFLSGKMSFCDERLFLDKLPW